MTRSLDDAERDFDRALSDGANAVEALVNRVAAQKKVAMQQLGWVVLAAGGRVEVGHHDMVQNPTVIISSNPTTGGFTVTAKLSDRG